MTQMSDRRRSWQFHFVDVFAVEPLTGNSLVVVEDAVDLTVHQLQRIAREFNQSETTFILPPTRPDADWRLRSFTATGAEVFGAGGHNSLGAWWWLADAGKLNLEHDLTVFRQEIGDRVSPVAIGRRNGGLAYVEMEQSPLEAGRHVTDLGTLTRSLGITPTDLAMDHLPCQVVSTGVAHLLVPIRDRETVDRITPNGHELRMVLAGVEAEGCYVFSLEPPHNDAAAYARFFNPTVGIVEDPATGTAAGPLAAQLVSHGLVPPGRMTIEQGTALGRPSLIEVHVLGDTVSVSAHAIVVADGVLRL
jgi:trans-2,3-dihydro-3-hydroxyanthranilate isomerase